MRERGSLFLLVGPSGVGKSSLMARAIEAVSELAYVPSVTTRSPRPGEVPGETYDFVSQDQFTQRQRDGQILEWQEHFGNRYGTSKERILARLEAGLDAMTDVEVLGAHEILVQMPLEACAIGISAPSRAELDRRLAGRGPETAQQLDLRRRRANAESSVLGSLDFLVVNDQLDRAAAELIAAVHAHHAQRALYRHARQRGLRPVARSAVFHAPTGEEDGPLGQLAKTRLGASESDTAAVARSLVLARLRAGTDPDPDEQPKLRCYLLEERQLEHELPEPWLEIERHLQLKPEPS